MRRQSKGDAQLAFFLFFFFLQMTALRYRLTEVKAVRVEWGERGAGTATDRVKGEPALALGHYNIGRALRRRQAAKIAKANMADVAWNLFLL